jgi:integrase
MCPLLPNHYRQRADLNAIAQFRFGEFVSEIYFPFYAGNGSTRPERASMNRVSVHLVTNFGDRELSSVKRDELQDLLDAKAKGGLSFSVVDHLKARRRFMSTKEVQTILQR